MPTYTQANQPIEILTPLGKDVLLINGFHGDEGISSLFEFHVDMMAENKKDIPFEKLLGQRATIRLNLPNTKPRFFNGICSRFSQGEGDAEFTTYHMEIVPQFWFLTKRAQTRMFQQMSVPDILKKVLTGLDVTFQLEGTFQPRNYCVQYRETDFNFASRLMEDEGIYYFFTHTVDGHKMILANTPASHPDMPVINKLTFEKNLASAWLEDRVVSWQKQQELVTGQFTLWDHKFEVHGRNLEAKKGVVDSLQVGKVAHKVKAGTADSREIYDYPGAYGLRFDGINPGGGDQAAEVKKIFQENERLVGIRAQEEAALSVTIRGASTCRSLVSGHKFSLQKHPNADGDYVLSGVHHQTSGLVDYRVGQSSEFQYDNSFIAIPFAMPFRPQHLTPKPFVQGTQTAIVVGPAGEEIFTDKYSRVKVQFHWDREGKFDAKSSCWIRVSTIWAGKTWGIVNIPRIGHEVIVGFEEGDPDLPIIIGSVFNADHMPPGELPKDKKVSGLRSNSTPGGGGYNGMIFNDTKGKEGVTVHAQYNMDTVVEHDQTSTIHNNRTDKVDVNDSETVGSNQTIKIGANQSTEVGSNESTKVGSNQTLDVASNQTTKIGADQKLTVNANQTTDISADQKLTIGGSQKVSVTGTQTIDVTGADKLTVGSTLTIAASGAIKISSDASITLVVGGSSIKIAPGGIDIVSSSPIKITGATVNVNS